MEIYVKTVYDDGYRLPNIEIYKTELIAKNIIDTTLKWGISIYSCKIISKKEAEKLIEKRMAKK